MNKNINLFGEDITKEIEAEERKHKYSERAKKAAETRKRHKAEKEAEKYIRETLKGEIRNDSVRRVFT